MMTATMINDGGVLSLSKSLSSEITGMEFSRFPSTDGEPIMITTLRFQENTERPIAMFVPSEYIFGGGCYYVPDTYDIDYYRRYLTARAERKKRIMKNKGRVLKNKP
jgi:hypothetical protein